jgi:hypothetical protein
MTEPTKADLQDRLKKLQTLQQLTGTLLSRISHFGRLGYEYDGDRDLYEVLGYKLDLTFEDYYAQYRRQDMAKTVINKPVNTTWRGPVTIVESDDADDTPLEKEWKELDKRLGMKSIFTRLDRLTRLGEYGILFLGLSDTQTKEQLLQPVTGKPELIYVKPLAERNAEIKTWVTDSNDERYGLPLTYQITVSMPGSDSTQELQVHYSRVIHIPGEALLENELRSAPALEVVWNRLKDLEKIVGSSGEMFWRGARPGYQAKTKEGYLMSPTFAEDIQEQINEYEHNLRRFLALDGTELEALTAQVADPQNHVEVQLMMISAVTGIPKRILVGSERGELASSQDQKNWFDTIQSRREEYAEPVIIRPFVDRCVDYGILPPAGQEGYSIGWKSLHEQSDQDKANVGKTRSEALKNYGSVAVNQDVMPLESFYRLILNLTDDEIELVMRQQRDAIDREENDFVEGVVV